MSFAAFISSGFISREALAISTVPLIIAAMPVPVPPPVTEMRTSGLTSTYASAQASARFTSVSEPLFSIVRWAEPLLADEPPACACTGCVLHPATSTLATSKPATASHARVLGFGLRSIMRIPSGPRASAYQQARNIDLRSFGPEDTLRLSV